MLQAPGAQLIKATEWKKVKYECKRGPNEGLPCTSQRWPSGDERVENPF